MKSLPRCNGAKRIGARPGNPVYFFLPVTDGTVSAKRLPEGIAFDARKNIVSGVIRTPGSYPLEFIAENENGAVSFSVELVIGEEIALTPPMGWNSWYCLSESVSDGAIRETARAMVARGLAAHGWSYINIDDCWQGERGGKFNALQGNERFPDMHALAEYIHSLGLRFGLYSTPWISSYAGFRGGSDDGGYEQRFYLSPEERLQPNQVFGRFPSGRELGQNRTGSVWHFDDDVRQWAEWGVDFVKVDWYINDIPTTERISRALRSCGRDIVLSLSNGSPYQLAPELSKLAQMWRITGDIKDTWESISRIGFEHNPGWWEHMAPGHWNDPDMLQIGAIGIPNRPNPTYKPTNLTPEEQKMQFSLWSLLSAPLLLSCDIAGMDEATFQLLTNDDVIAIDQDILAAKPTMEAAGSCRIYRKALADGGSAIGVFNLSNTPVDHPLLLGNTAKDLWTGETFSTEQPVLRIAPHGVRLLKQNA